MNRNQNSLILLAGYVSQAYKLYRLSICFLTRLHYVEYCDILMLGTNDCGGGGGGRAIESQLRLWSDFHDGS